MTTQTDYTPAEWDLLVGAPALTALIVIQAHPCGPGVADKIVRAALAAMAEQAPPAPGSALIAAVIGAARAGQSPRWPAEYPRELPDVGHWALERCRQVAALLAQKAPEAEAEAYRHWLSTIGQRVALAADDHSLPNHVSAARIRQRRAALDQLAIAFDFPFATDGMCALTPCWRAPMP
ncbi:MAG: hypothetical protein HGA45_17310 [Chloroflexales bacterium]|nr:hypothetical protein [Chloroflexales bacterium]